jgi:hypothetical protein
MMRAILALVFLIGLLLFMAAPDQKGSLPSSQPAQQLAPNPVTRSFPVGVNQIARSRGILHGAEWSWADTGHFEVRLGHSWQEQPREPAWPRVLTANLRNADELDPSEILPLLPKVAPIPEPAPDRSITLQKLPKDKRELAQKMLEAAAHVGVDPVYQLSMTYMESSFNPTLPARTSSAYGLCQLLKWDRLHVYEIGLTPSVDQQVKACALKTLENRNKFLDIFQREPTVQELYLVHWQGIGGAVLLLMAKATESVEAVLNKWQFQIGHEHDYGSWVVKANKVMKGMTVADYLKHIERRSQKAISLVSN